MNALVQVCLSNVVMAAGLSVPAFLYVRCGRNPHVARGLWLLVILKLLAPPIVPWEWREAAPEVEVITPVDWSLVTPTLLESTDVTDSAPPTRPSINIPWTAYLLLAWLMGSFAFLGLALRRLWRFRRLVAETALGSDLLQTMSHTLAAQLGTQAPEVRLVNSHLPPLLWHFIGRPVILLPGALLERLDAPGTRIIIAHELVHLKRRDHWLRRLEMLLLTLYWWLPLAWWARRELRRAEEQCCDSAVLAHWPGQAAAYVEALWQTIEFLSPQPAAVPCLASSFGYGASLKRRFIMLSRCNIPTRMNRVSWLALLAAGFLVLPMAAQDAAPPTPDANATIGTTDDFADPNVATGVSFSDGEEATELENVAATSVAFGQGAPAESVEVRVDRLERKLDEVLSALKQQPTQQTNADQQPTAIQSIPTVRRSQGTGPNRYLGTATRRAVPNANALGIAQVMRLEGDELAAAVSDLEMQLAIRHTELQKLTKEIKRLEQLLNVLRSSETEANLLQSR